MQAPGAFEFVSFSYISRRGGDRLADRPRSSMVRRPAPLCFSMLLLRMPEAGGSFVPPLSHQHRENQHRESRFRCSEMSAASPPSSLGETLRTDFALLDQSVWEGKPLVYLDSAATSQKPASVIGAMTHHLEHDNANVHRGAHSLSARSTEAYEGARAKIAKFVNAADDREIVFTRGAAEAINLIAASWGAEHLKAGDEVVLTVMEHHSNIVPWQLLAARTGVVLRFAKLREDETLDMDHLRSLVVPGKTKLISIVHVSNTLGCVNPV